MRDVLSHLHEEYNDWGTAVVVLHVRLVVNGHEEVHALWSCSLNRQGLVVHVLKNILVLIRRLRESMTIRVQVVALNVILAARARTSLLRRAAV